MPVGGTAVLLLGLRNAPEETDRFADLLARSERLKAAGRSDPPLLAHADGLRA